MNDNRRPTKRATSSSRRAFLRTAGGIALTPLGTWLGGYADNGEGGTGRPATTSRVPTNTTFHRQGFTIPGFSYRGPQALEQSLMDAAKSGANSVIFDYHLVLVGGLTGSDVQADFALDRVMQEVTLAKGLGFYTLVKPVLLVGDYDDANHTHWQRIAPSDPGAWFASYAAQLNRLVRRSEADKIDALVLGNELHSMSSNAEHTSRWRALVRDIRSEFSGRIGYNAAGLIGPFETSQEHLQVTFSDALDFIGISAYPRLSAKLDADADDYRAGWRDSAYGEDLVKQLNDFIAGQTKDVYLTELGSPATRGGSYFFKRSERAEYDLAQQAAFFDVSLDILATAVGDGLKGVYIYNWHANAGDDFGFVPTAKPGAYVWNVYGKPAQDAIRRRFLK